VGKTSARRVGGSKVGGTLDNVSDNTCNNLQSTVLLDFLDTWVAGGLGLGVGLCLPQAPQSPCESVSVGHVRTPISSSACSVCSSFLLHVNQHLLFPTRSALLELQRGIKMHMGSTYTNAMRSRRNPRKRPKIYVHAPRNAMPCKDPKHRPNPRNKLATLNRVSGHICRVLLAIIQKHAQ
jgi:hypothetical protein